MRRDDPLDDMEWLFLERLMGESEIRPERLAELQAATRGFLDGVTEFLDHPRPRRSWYDVPHRRWDLVSGIGLTAEDASRAQALCRRVADTGGTGSRDIQETLFGLISHAGEPTSIPFWVELLDYTRPRDQFAERRRIHALAALARMVIQRDDTDALAALRQAMHHSRAEIRALATHYLGRALLYQAPEDQDEAQEEERPPRPLPLDVVAELNEIAGSDPAFGPRFQARAVLREPELPAPMDNPDGVYAFRVTLKWGKVSRTIELRSKQTLDDLHFAIQSAFRWDSDHLYSFYMSGEEDDRYAFACPYEEDRPPWTDEAIIGELGLVKGHQFAYLFDYGDNHVFTIKVEDIQPQAGRGKYPRVVEKQGKAPEQYR